jgi:2-amino-4-hydroxy-6-hydroxymethyldihydropteridine diphosphokinase
VQVVRTSNLYRSAPMHVTEQPPFLNAAALITTSLPPEQLLSTLKRVEASAGRDLHAGQRWGPRPLDLDIIFYGDTTMHSEHLTLPHERWLERPFVALPVSELARDGDDDADLQVPFATYLI